MAEQIIVGFILTAVFYGFAPRKFNSHDSEIIESANKLIEGKLEEAEFGPTVYKYEIRGLINWIKVWSIIWLIYFIVLAINFFFFYPG